MTLVHSQNIGLNYMSPFYSSCLVCFRGSSAASTKIWERVAYFLSILFIATIPPRNIRDTPSLVLYKYLVRSWLYNQDASLNGFFCQSPVRAFIDWSVLRLHVGVSQTILVVKFLLRVGCLRCLPCLSGSAVGLVSPFYGTSGGCHLVTPQDSSCWVCFGGLSDNYAELMWERVVRFLSLFIHEHQLNT